MGTTRENKQRAHEYTEGQYLICRMGDGSWQPFEMGVRLKDTGYDFPTLREARAWCKKQQPLSTRK